MKYNSKQIDKQLLIKLFSKGVRLPIANKSHSFIFTERQILIDYISIIAYPEFDSSGAKKRQNFVDAIYTAILREHGLTNKTGLKKYTKGKSWTSIDKSIAACQKRFYRAFVLFQCFEDFTLHKKEEPDSPFSWNDFLIRALAFYQNHEEGYAFDRTGINFQTIKNDIIDYPESKENRFDVYRDNLRPVREEWKQVKKVLHLIEGIAACYRMEGISSLPHIKLMLETPDWIYKAIVISQDIVIRYSTNPEFNHRIKIDPSDFIFVNCRSQNRSNEQSI